jgi:hypothetical protein
MHALFGFANAPLYAGVAVALLSGVGCNDAPTAPLLHARRDVLLMPSASYLEGCGTIRVAVTGGVVAATPADTTSCPQLAVIGDSGAWYALDSGIVHIPVRWTLTSLCATVAADLRGYDLVYKRLTVPGESGDALVPGSSQMYPNAPSYAQFAVHDADSHVGVLQATSSTEPQVQRAINQIFGVTQH